MSTATRTRQPTSATAPTDGQGLVHQTVRRATGAMGVAYAAASTAMFALLGKVPDVGSSGGGARHYFAAHAGGLLAASISLVVASALSVAFFAGLRRLLDGGGQSGVAADIGLASAVLVFAMAGVAAGALEAGSLLARAQALGPSEARLVVALVVGTVNLSAGPTLTLAAGFGLALRNSDQMPRWASWSFLGVGLAHLGALGSVAPRGPLVPGGALSYFGPVLFLIWVSAVSVVLLRRATYPPRQPR